MIFEELHQAAPNNGLNGAFDLRVPEAALGLPFELRVPDLHAHHGHEALADILAGEVRHVFFEEALLAAVVVQDAGEGRTESGDVGAAVVSADAIGEGEAVLNERFVVLESHLNNDVFNRVLSEYDLLVDGVAPPVEVSHEAEDAAVEEIGDVVHGPAVGVPVALEMNGERPVEVCHLPEPVGDGGEVE